MGSRESFNHHVGPWEEYEYLVLRGNLVKVDRPKWHRTYRFADGGVFKFWVLQDRLFGIVFREKVDYWAKAPDAELPWDIQDRICFMVKAGENEFILNQMDKEKLEIVAATPWWVDYWVKTHPKEWLL